MYVYTELAKQAVKKYVFALRIRDERIKNFLLEDYIKYMVAEKYNFVPVVVTCSGEIIKNAISLMWKDMPQAMREAFTNDEGVKGIPAYSIDLHKVKNMARSLRLVLKGKPTAKSLAGHEVPSLLVRIKNYRAQVHQRWMQNRAKYGKHHLLTVGNVSGYLITNNAVLNQIGIALRNCMRDCFRHGTNTLGTPTFKDVHYIGITQGGKWSSLATVAIVDGKLKVSNHLGVESQEHVSAVDAELLVEIEKQKSQAIRDLLQKFSVKKQDHTPSTITLSNLQRTGRGNRAVGTLSRGDLVALEQRTIRFLDYDLERNPTRGLVSHYDIPRFIPLEISPRSIIPRWGSVNFDSNIACDYKVRIVADGSGEKTTDDVPHPELKLGRRSDLQLEQRTLNRQLAQKDRSIPKWFRTKGETEV